MVISSFLLFLSSLNFTWNLTTPLFYYIMNTFKTLLAITILIFGNVSTASLKDMIWIQRTHLLIDVKYQSPYMRILYV